MKKASGEHPLGDSVQGLLLILFIVVWMIDSFFLHASTILSNQFPLYIRLIISGFLFVLIVLLFKSSHKVVAHHGEPPKKLIEDGAFKYVRHPLYLGIILFYLCLAISTASIPSLLLFVIICVFYDYIASYEEKFLEKRFGDIYKKYERRTGKWLPIISKI